MKKINLSITGCMGRMGQQLIKTIKKEKKFKIHSLTEHKVINKRFNGLKPLLNTENAFKRTDVIIDFTTPKCTLEVLKIASKLKKRVVIGTTGFTKKEESLIKSYSKKIPKEDRAAFAAVILTIRSLLFSGLTEPFDFFKHTKTPWKVVNPLLPFLHPVSKTASE